MKRFLIPFLLTGLLAALPAAEDPWIFNKGQIFISVYAGFVQTHSRVSMDTVYDISFKSALSRNISLGFSYSQRQSQSKDNKKLNVPLNPIILGTIYEKNPEDYQLSNANISSKMYTLEGEYHFITLNVKRLDISAGAGVGLELNRENLINFKVNPQEERLEISNSDKNKYYPTANFFAGIRWYLAQTLALSLKAGYQYSGVSGYNWLFGLGITFRVI